MARIYKNEGFADCNRCDRQCPHQYKFRSTSGKTYQRRGIQRHEYNCTLHQLPREGWSVAELSLAHPQSLQSLEGLKDVGIDFNIGMFLRGG